MLLSRSSPLREFLRAHAVSGASKVSRTSPTRLLAELSRQPSALAPELRHVLLVTLASRRTNPLPTCCGNVVIAYVARWYQCTLVLLVLLDTDLHNAQFVYTLEPPHEQQLALSLHLTLDSLVLVNLGPGMNCVRYLHDHIYAQGNHLRGRYADEGLHLWRTGSCAVGGWGSAYSGKTRLRTGS